MRPTAAATRPAPPVLPALLSAISLAVFLCFAMLVPAPALGQAGWKTFSSSEAGLPSSAPAFTVKYPSWFEGSGKATPGAGRPERIEIAKGEDSKKARYFELSVTLEGISKGGLETLEQEGPDTFFGAVGGAIRSNMNGSYSGARAFVYRGLPAADIDVSSVARPEGSDGSFSVLYVQRSVARGETLVTLVCLTGGSAQEASFKDFALREDSAVKEICEPYLDSLEFPK
ncbi:MAG: hypothetical protein LBT40_17095 [Deltaproteobacteria bacterium]|jgi:hypothetical protein|nr:hypothetical protein [Deltaproteobacteria bacterium]